jgi:hypothetical protein
MRIFALTTPEEDAMGFWEEFWHDLYGLSYSNLGLETGTVRSVGLIVLGIFIGIIIACLAMAYNKQVLGGFVRRVLGENCRSAEGAKTLEELGYKKNPFIRSAVQRNVSLRRVLHCVEEEKFYREQNEDREAYEKKRAEEPSLPKYREREYLVDPSRDHFYVPEDKCDMAERKFDAKGSSWVATIVWIAVIIVAFFVLMAFLPDILETVNDFVGSFKNNDPYAR